MRFLLSSLLSLIIVGSTTLFAQQQDIASTTTAFLSPMDSVLVKNDGLTGHLIYQYELKAGETLYGASQYFGLSLDEIYLINPKLKARYSTGDKVRVPIPKPAIRAFVPYDSINYYSPVFYTFKKGETIYGLIHRTLKLENENQLYLNNPGLSPETIKVGQQLFIGWLSTAGIDPKMQVSLEDPYVLRNAFLKKRWLSESKGKKLNTQKGKAAWIRDGDRNKFMALHRSAPINSLIEVMDKRTGKVLYCRVVGRIPDQVYDKNVQVVVSPLLVKAFSVRDRFFYVQVKHY